jgi:hypothetical protein
MKRQKNESKTMKHNPSVHDFFEARKFGYNRQHIERQRSVASFRVQGSSVPEEDTV